MSEGVEAWWARRQFSRDAEVPYAVGTFREAWASYPALIRQYHPEFNAGITLTQIPPAAEVLLLWQCEVGHLFAATPGEQRNRPGRERRRSSWCPECLAGARPPRIRPAGAPPPAAEAQLRQDLAAALEFTAGMNAVRVARPFFDHVEVWPDILIPELRIAVEYDTPGRHGLEHVGRRAEVDRRKDRALRAARWEVVRIRTGRLEKLGPWDLQVSGTGKRTISSLQDVFRDIRGDLIVDAYRR